MELDAQREKNWLDHFNIKCYPGFHASGHAHGGEILEMIREIRPEKVYPVHTHNQDEFKVLEEEGIQVINPELKRGF